MTLMSSFTFFIQSINFFIIFFKLLLLLYQDIIRETDKTSCSIILILKVTSQKPINNRSSQIYFDIFF